MRVFQSAEDEWGCRYIGSIKAAETTASKRFYNIHANTHRCAFIVWHSVVKQHVTLHTTEIMTVYTASSGMFLDIKRVNWGDLAAGVHAVRTCFCFLFYPLGYNYPSQFFFFFSVCLSFFLLLHGTPSQILRNAKFSCILFCISTRGFGAGSRGWIKDFIR